MTEQEKILKYLQKALKNPVGISHIDDISLSVQERQTGIHGSVDDIVRKTLTDYAKNMSEGKGNRDLAQFSQEIWNRLDRDPRLLSVLLEILKQTADFVGPIARPKPVLGNMLRKKVG